MIIRLALAGAVLAAAAIVSMPQARDASVLPMGKALERSRAASPLVEVARRKRGARETPPETSAIPPGKASNGEVLFGVQDVGFQVDRDIIRVGGEIGKFDRIRLRALKNEILVTDLKAIFADGSSETLL